MSLTHFLRDRTQAGLKAKVRCTLRKHTAPGSVKDATNKRLLAVLLDPYLAIAKF